MHRSRSRAKYAITWRIYWCYNGTRIPKINYIFSLNINIARRRSSCRLLSHLLKFPPRPVCNVISTAILLLVCTFNHIRFVYVFAWNNLKNRLRAVRQSAQNGGWHVIALVRALEYWQCCISISISELGGPRERICDRPRCIFGITIKCDYIILYVERTAF